MNISFLMFVVFLIGLCGVVLNFRNLLLTIFSFELMYLGLLATFISLGIVNKDPLGQISALLFLIIAASEAAVGLGILVVLDRFGKTIEFKSYQNLKS